MYNFFALYHSSTYTFILWTLLSSPLPLSLQNRRIAYVVGALYILLLFLNFINYFIWNNWRLKSFIYHSRLQRAKHNFIRLVKRQSRFFCTSFVEYRRRFYDTTNLCVRNSNHERRINTTDDGMIFWIDLTHRFDGFIFMANSCYQWSDLHLFIIPLEIWWLRNSPISIERTLESVNTYESRFESSMEW